MGEQHEAKGQKHGLMEAARKIGVAVQEDLI
jgi:hypothetical protein